MTIEEIDTPTAGSGVDTPVNAHRDIESNNINNKYNNILHTTRAHETDSTSPVMTAVDISDADDVKPKRRAGRPKTNPDMHKHTPRHYVTIYLKYPTKEDKERLRNIARAINKANDLRYQRMIRIANTESEAMRMVQAERKERKEYERKYRVWLRRKIRADKELEERTFRTTVKAICKAIKNGKPAEI